MSSLKELLAQRAALEQQIADTQQRERETAVAQVRQIMQDSGLTIADLTAGRQQAKRVPGASKVAPKYRNKDTGETWSGRGLQPKWLKAAVSAGAKLEDFTI